ncbi:Outer membrane protein assembly factor BamE [compost metagenome]
MLRNLTIPVLALCMLILAACQTSMVRQFDQVTLGMEKDDVLNLMGSPQRNQRYKGKDKWTYIFYDKRIRHEKEVQFFEGNAVYVGNISQPAPDQTAEAVDARNAAADKAIEESMIKEVQANRKAYDSYQAETKGEDKVRYVPQFEPIQ